MLSQATPKTPKIRKQFICIPCDFKCCKQSDYDRHILTGKHKNANDANAANNHTPLQREHKCNNCKTIFKHLPSLSRHKKTCNTKFNENIIPETIIPENVVVQDSSNNDIVHLLIKENSDFKTMIMDLVKSNTDIQKQMLEVCKNIQPSNNNTINNTDNSNKTFNLQVFLNEKCKDAMNLEDFANSIQLKLSDLIRVGEEGYIPGMSKVIIEWLGGLKVCDRPIHCSDEKREVIQVKVADKWEKEAITSEKLMNAVRIVEKKQFDMITTFRDTYPECMNSESHHNDMLIKLFQNLSNSREPEFIKVMKKVAKSVVINKEENA